MVLNLLKVGMLMKKKLNNIFARLLQKEWPPASMQKYFGDVQESYLTYANDPAFRKNAASGGSVTALISHLFDSGQINGALVLRSVINKEGNLRPEFYIAKTTEELKNSQGSKYITVHFASQALPLIRAFPGKLAVVALPCDITILNNVRLSDPALSKKIILTISLFCGHNSEPALTDTIIDKLNVENQVLSFFRYRFGHWRGKIKAEFSQGKKVEKPFSYFSVYQNLYFFSQKKCHHCSDHTGYHADISAGDIWSLKMKYDPIKHTSLISRTKFASKIVEEAIENEVLKSKPVDLKEIADGQARTMPFHYNVSARAKVGLLFGEKIKDTVNEKVRLQDYIVALMILFNERISRSTVGRKIIFSIPRPILKLYLYVLKFLESL